MIGRRIIATIFLLPAIGSGYLTWLLWQAGDSGKWLFLVFTLFFLLLVATPILPKLKSKPPPESTSTRFGPHWFMMLAILVVAASVLAAIFEAILRL